MSTIHPVPAVPSDGTHKPVPTIQEAYAIMARFNASHFNLPCGTHEHARYSIPADFKRDDDLLMMAFIRWAESLQSALEACRASKEREMAARSRFNELIELAYTPSADPAARIFAETWRSRCERVEAELGKRKLVGGPDEACAAIQKHIEEAELDEVMNDSAVESLANNLCFVVTAALSDPARSSTEKEKA